MATSGSFNTTGYQGRYLTFSWSLSSQSTETNSSVISWSLKGAGTASSNWYNAGNFKVVINGTTVYSSSTRIKLYNGTLVASGSFTINHNNDGTKTFSASAQAGIYYVAVNCSGSGSWSLPQISRYATILSATNFTDEQDPSIEFSNPTNAKLQLKIEAGGNTSLIVRDNLTNAKSPYKFTLTEAERNSLRNLCPNSNTLSVRFTVGTYSGSSVTNWSYLDRTMTIVNAAPTISGISYRDTNSTTTAITNNNQLIIQNRSTVSFTFSSLTALKGATLSRVAITVNAVTVTANLSGSSVSNRTVSFGSINSSSNLTANITLTDSRGNTRTQSTNITMLAWSLPTAIITCYRRNNYYTETDINVNADYASLNGNNTITIQYQTKEEDSSSWSALASLQDSVTQTINLDNTEAWDIRVIVTDRLGSTTYNISLDRGIPIVYFDRLKRSVGVNCFPGNNNSIETSGLIKSDYGLNSFTASIGGGSTGYARIATVKITNTYANAPIEFKFIRRGDLRAGRLYLCFNNANNSDPTIRGLYIDSLTGLNSFDAFAYKTDTSTWDIYIEKSESYDVITVITTCPDYMRQRVKISYENNLLTSVPSGATSATAL